MSLTVTRTTGTANASSLNSIVSARIHQRTSLEAERKKTNEALQDFMSEVTETFTALKLQNTQLKASLTNLEASLKDVETARQAEKKAFKARYKRDIGYIKKELAAMNRYIREHSHIIVNACSTGTAITGDAPCSLNPAVVGSVRRAKLLCGCTDCQPPAPFHKDVPPDFYKIDQKS